MTNNEQLETRNEKRETRNEKRETKLNREIDKGIKEQIRRENKVPGKTSNTGFLSP